VHYLSSFFNAFSYDVNPSAAAANPATAQTNASDGLLSETKAPHKNAEQTTPTNLLLDASPLHDMNPEAQLNSFFMSIVLITLPL